MKYILTSGQTGTGASVSLNMDDAVSKSSQKKHAFQAAVTGTGAVSATVQIQASNDPTVLGWLTLGTITLSGTTTTTDGFSSEEAWTNIRSNVTAVSGTGAAVTVVMGI